MGMTIRGKVETKQKFAKFKTEVQEAAGEGAERSAKKLYEESQIQVPRDTNALAETGRLVIHSDSGPKRIWGVKYGTSSEDSPDDSVVDYAAAVHEILKASHAPPTKAKYVEDPLVQGIVYYKRVSLVEVRRAVRRSFR